MKNNKTIKTIESVSLFLLFMLLPFMFLQPLSAQNLQEQVVTLDMKNTTLKNVLWEIERQTKITFVYNSEEVSTTIPALQMKDKTVTEALDLCFANTGLTYFVENGTIVIKQKDNTQLVKPQARSQAPAQQRVKITGYVFDNEKIPLYGAVVAEEGTANTALVEEDGSYSIEITPRQGISLVYVYIGMQTQTIEVFDRKVIDVMMAPLEGTLQEVVITGYGEVLKEAYTGSATIISSDDIINRATGTVENMLQGLSPGLVTSNSGQPGEISEMRLRGFGSMSSGNQPLYVIDGVIFDQDNMSGHSAVTANPMATLNPSDIANITVLRDAASASLYGSQGANGVIVITTKRGVSSDKIRYNLSMQTGFSHIFSAAKPRFVDADQYRNLWTEGQFHYLIQQKSGNDFNANLKNLYDDKLNYLLDGKNYHEWFKLAQQDFNAHYNIPKSDGTYSNYDLWGIDNDKMPRVDWYDEITRSAPFQNVDFSMTGGSSALQYYLSMGYLDQQGVILNSELKRYSARIKLTSDQTKRFLYWGIDANFSKTNQSGPAGNGLLFNMPQYASLLLPGVVPVYLDDDSYNYMFPNNLLNTSHNPVASANMNQRNRPLVNLYTAGWLQFNFTDYLNFRAGLYQYYITSRRADYFSKEFGSGYNADGQLTEYDSRRLKLTSRNMLNFKYNINNRHRMDATAGIELIDFRQEWNSLSVVGFMNDERQALSSGSEVSDWSGSGYDYATVSFITRADYSYRYRYFIGGSFRQDRSSRFSPEHRVGNFWSVSGGYRITNEQWEWMKNVRKIFNNIRFKASYGVNGTVPGNYYNWRNLYSSTSTYNSEHALYQSFRPTYDLSWEKNNIFNLGVDIGILDNRYKVSVEYYNRKSSDLLQDVPVSGVSGFSTMLMNTSAGIDNKGFEFDINALLIDNIFKWNISGNLATLSSKYYGLEQDLIGRHIMRNGESVASWFLYEFAGINPETGSVQFYAFDEEGNKIIAGGENPSARHIVGKGIPSVTGGFSTMLSYKGWELSTLFTYAWGHMILDGMGSTRTKVDGRFHYNIEDSQLDRWTPENIYATNPIRINGKLSEGTSTRYLHKGDYLKLKNIKLQYTFPSRTFRKVGITGVSLFTQAENLFVWTALDGYDPDMQMDGYRNADRYPTATTYTLGAAISF
jgi:TonB-linked SusC/RagA family outer membrane protein